MNGKRTLGLLLCLTMLAAMFAGVLPVAASADAGGMIVTVGADLTEEQRDMILRYFNVEGQYYTAITVTNDDEWTHLGRYMSRDIVGYRTISCALIRPMASGGIQVKTANLTYVTSNMIASNLATAGVTNCEVLAAAPFPVSGTGALTGALMAYENLTGVTLSQSKKDAAVQEFATTYSLGETVGQQEAQQIVNDVKLQVITESMQTDNSVTEEQIAEIVNDVVNNYTNNTTNNIENDTTVNVTNNGLSAEEVAALQELAAQIAKEAYEQGTIDALAQIQQTLEGQTQVSSTDATAQILQEASPTTAAEDASPTDSGDGGLTGLIADMFQPADEPDGAAAGSAADQALAADSLLNNTNEAALVDAENGGTVISSSTAESTIDEALSVNLDTLIGEQTAPEEALEEAPMIPEAEDAYVLPAPEEETPEEVFEPEEETAEAPEEAPAEETAAVMLRDAPVTAEDLRAGTAQLRSLGEAEDGTAQAAGTAAIALALPYDDLIPQSGVFVVTDETGAEAARLELYDPTAETEGDGAVVIAPAAFSELPEGWQGCTELLMLPEDAESGGRFTPRPGHTYAYTLEARLVREADGAALDVLIDGYRPYETPVSEAGFAAEGLAPAMPYGEGLTGAVLFPEDGSTVYATVSADGDSMASVRIFNPETGESGLPGVTAGAGDIVELQPIAPGPVTLTVTYYSQVPSEEAEAEPEAVGTAVLTVLFTE